MKTFIIVALSLALLGLTCAETLRPQVTGAIEDGFYIFTDAATGLNLAIKDNSAEEGASFTVAKASDSNTQKFFVKKVNQDTFYINNLFSNKYLTTSAEGLVQKTLTYAKEQEWTVTKSGNGNFVFKSKSDNKFIHATKEGEKVNFNNDANTQGFKSAPTQWKEDEEGGASDRVVAMAAVAKSARKFQPGTYLFMIVDADDVFDVTQDHKVLSNQVNFELKSQQWKVEQAGEFFRIVSVSNGQALAVTDAETGKEIVTVAIAQNDNKQLWRIQETAEEMWAVINAASGLAATSPYSNGQKLVEQYYASSRFQLYTPRAI